MIDGLQFESANDQLLRNLVLLNPLLRTLADMNAEGVNALFAKVSRLAGQAIDKLAPTETATAAAENTCGDTATAAGPNAGFGPWPSDQELEELIAEMPGGKDGYMKSWGYAHLARAAVTRFGLNDAYAGAREDLQTANGALAHQREVNANQAKTITQLMADAQSADAELVNSRKTISDFAKTLHSCGYLVVLHGAGRAIAYKHL